MSEPDADARRAERFAAVLAGVEAALDWPRLERVYCEVEPDVPAGTLVGFFGEQERESLREAAVRFAADLAERLKPGGASLYVGAGVAELAPIVAERVLLDREVHVVVLPGVEAEELTRAFAEAGRAASVRLARVETRPLAVLPSRSVDHVWLASVLTDPDAFPALHAALYERGRPKGRALANERTRALALLESAFRGLSERGWVTTSDEELELVEEALAARGLAAHVPELGRLSPIVGDVLRHLSVAPRLPAPPPAGKLSERPRRRGPTPSKRARRP